MVDRLFPHGAVSRIEGGHVLDEAANRIEACRALVLAPHPDDEVFGCGGAIMRHIEMGVPVNVVVVSDGAHGVSDENRAAYVLRRRDESMAAARVIGYGTPIFWDYRDREISYGEKLIRQILDAIANADADIVYAPSVFEMHPDHRALGMAVVEAVRRYGKGIRLALYEVGMPLRPNLLLDISELAERKMAAMACFVSQNAKQRYDLDIAALNRYRSYTLPVDVTAAEAYILVAAEELGKDPLKLYQSEHDRQSELGLALDSRDTPLVSVIIRSIDRPTLFDALDSVALQTYPNIEVVVVDAIGKGHRGVGEWCGRFPLRMVGSGQRLKRSLAANFGLDSACGAYFIFLDDDDLFDPDHISALVEAIDASRNCLAAYAGVRVENEAGATIAVYNQAFSAARLMSGNFLPIHAVLFSRDLVVRGCRFDENLDSYEDWDFWLQVARQTDFSHAVKVSAVYRAQLGESGMSLALTHQLELQRQARLTVWGKWWPEWTIEDFDHLVADFHQQIALLHGQLGDAAHNENELRRLLAEKESLQAERDRQIATLDQEVMERDEQIVQLHAVVEALLNSRSWKLTAPLRYLGQKMAYARKIFGLRGVIFDSALRYSRRESAYKLFRRSFDVLRHEGLNGIKLRLKALNANHALTATGIEAKPITRIESHDYQPLSAIDMTKYEYFFFDVFDTAIIRLFQRPVDLFEYISFKTKISDFHARRVQHEAGARERSVERKDIGISEIYNNLAGVSIDEEIAAELKFCIANPEIHSFYSKLLAAGKKIYFVSDMYLDRSTISNILEKNGFSTYEDIYVSSEDDLVKGDGSRFDWIKKTIPESIGTAIHIGDNFVSDFMQPRAHGFEALHYMESDAYYRHDSFLYSKIDFLNSKRSVGLSFMVSIFRYWKLGFHDQPPDYWRQFGFLYGGALVSAFCGFINEQIPRKNISCNKVYFLARDGDIMSQVYKLLYDDVEAVYLMASRRCMSFPSLKSLTHADDADALRQFTTPIGVDGVKDVMDRFCYTDLHDLEHDLARVAQNAPKWTDLDILDCILRNKKSIMEKVLKERGVLFDYLSKMGFFAHDDIVIADVGWNGSIQNYLVKLLDIWGYKKKRLHGFYLGVNDCAVHKQNMTGFLFDGDQSQFVDYFNLIELITSSPQNGIVRIDYGENGFVPVSGTICEHEKRRQLVAAEIQKGILDFARIVKRRNIGSLDFIRADDFETLFMSLREHASEEDVLQLGSLRHAAALGNNYGQHVLTKGTIKN